MSARPSTLPELRAAVERVLVARGEDASALSVSLETLRGSWRVETRAPVGSHPLAILTWGSSAATACGRLWSEILSRLEAEDDRAEAAVVAAETGRRLASAAFKVAYGVQ